jgi:hypothetical protein
VSESRPGMWSHVRSAVLMGVVTFVIWLLAESESLRTEKVRVEIQFRADPASNRLVRTIDNQEFNGIVTVRLQGSNARVDALAAELRKSIRLEPGMEAVSEKPGEHAVNLEAAIRALPVIRDSGVSVSEVEPSTATIFVDTLVTREVPVKVVTPEGQAVDGSPEASPATVQVTCPASAELPTETAALARLDATLLGQLPDGRRGTLTNIPLELPEPFWSMEGVRLIPAQVSITVRLRSRVDVYTIPSVPVQLRMPFDAAGRYDLDTDTTELREIAVVGPLDLIDQLKSGRLQPVATVPLSSQELEQAAASRQVLTKEPIFSDIPTPLSFDTKQKVIRVLVRKRETPSGTVPK